MPKRNRQGLYLAILSRRINASFKERKWRLIQFGKNEGAAGAALGPYVVVDYGHERGRFLRVRLELDDVEHIATRLGIDLDAIKEQAFPDLYGSAEIGGRPRSPSLVEPASE